MINTLGGCYEFHAGVSFLRAWGCDETALEWLGARFFFWSDPCGVLGLCQNFPSTHPPVTLPPPTGNRGDVVCPPPPPRPRCMPGPVVHPLPARTAPHPTPPPARGLLERGVRDWEEVLWLGAVNRVTAGGARQQGVLTRVRTTGRGSEQVLRCPGWRNPSPASFLSSLSLSASPGFPQLSPRVRVARAGWRPRRAS